MCKINCSGGCPDCDDPYAVFKQAIKEGKRVQHFSKKSGEWKNTNYTWSWSSPSGSYRIHPDDVNKTPTGVPHKHAALIKAWAENPSLKIEVKISQEHSFVPAKIPLRWYEHLEYRIKPEPKPDVVFSCEIVYNTGFAPKVYASSQGKVPSSATWKPNSLLTFDGETGKLKKVEIV